MADQSSRIWGSLEATGKGTRSGSLSRLGKGPQIEGESNLRFLELNFRYTEYGLDTKIYLEI